MINPLKQSKMTKVKIDFNQAIREFIFNVANVEDAYYSYLDIKNIDEDEYDTDELVSYLVGLDTQPSLKDIALKYGNLWATTQQDKWIDAGEYKINKELNNIYK